MRARPIFVLPAGESLSNYDFVPSREEIAAAKQLAKNRRHAMRVLVNLGHLLTLWTKEDEELDRRREERRQKHINAILAVAEQDRQWVERVNAIQEEQRKVTDYWLAEQKKTADAIHAAQLKRLEQITEDIRKDAA